MVWTAPANAADLVLGFILVMCRISGFMIACPPFMPSSIAPTFKTACTFILSLCLYLSLPHVALPQTPVLALALELVDRCRNGTDGPLVGHVGLFCR